MALPEPQEKLKINPEKGSEQPVSPEQETAQESQAERFEQRPEKQVEKVSEGKTSAEKVGEGTGGIATDDSIKAREQDRQKQIEGVLAEDLEDIYASLPPNKQQELKVKGEETARQINILLDKAKLSFKKIIKLIKSWMLIIPGVNKFFLEQEAKIKADKLAKMKDDKNFE